MQTTDSRRLTGPNLLLDGPGAVLDVEGTDEQIDAAVGIWNVQIRALLEAVGWDDAATVVRRYPGGASLAFRAPIDALYAATEVNEAAWDATLAVLSGEQLEDLRAHAQTLREAIAAEVNPALLQLKAAAEAHGVRFFSDDDEASIGSGTGVQTWPVNDLPDPTDIDWSVVHDVPVALITGTNGKSTTVRLAASIMRAAGRTAGLTSTDYVQVGDEIVEWGDYSGPGGGRTVLRDRRVEVALLEVARGGILRRGLAVNRADAAVVTNIARDHLGEYGIFTVDDLAEAKLVVRKALTGSAPLIVSADNPVLARYVTFGDANVRAFSLEGEATCRVEDGWIVWRGERVVAVDEVPITFGGAARYNVANALAATALARVLEVPVEAIADGLRAFKGTPDDNPGRGNWFTINGAQVLLDFAHNAHGVAAIVDTLLRLPARRRLILLGQAGDRSDDEIRALARAVAPLSPDRIVIAELTKYLRGRSPGEVPALLHDAFRALGFPESTLTQVPNCPDGVREALAWSQPGDQLLLLAHSQREQVLELLTPSALRASPPGEKF